MRVPARAQIQEIAALRNLSEESVALDVPIRISHPERDAESRRRVERRNVINRLL